jgi:hypothetical protein
VSGSLRVTVPPPFDRLAAWRVEVAGLQRAINTWVALPAGQHTAELRVRADRANWSASGTLTTSFSLVEDQRLDIGLPLDQLLGLLSGRE